MNIKAYLANIDMSIKDFCQLVGCAPSYLSSISKGRMKPSPRLARDIEKMTDGMVKIEASKKKQGPPKGSIRRRPTPKVLEENTANVAV